MGTQAPIETGVMTGMIVVIAGTTITIAVIVGVIGNKIVIIGIEMTATIDETDAKS